MMRFWLESISTSSSSNNSAPDVEEEKQEIQPISYSQQQQQQQESELQQHQHIFPIKFQLDESLPALVDRLSRRTLDWWSTLLVARACSDLVAAGWRPYEDHSAIVMHLLNIAQQGIELRHISPTATDQESREQRLAATSSAAEAIAALASSSELLPCTASPEVVKQLLELKLAAGKTSRFVHSQYPLGTPQSLAEAEELQQERETFLSQRASCFSDTAHSLWVLLAHESSAVVVMSTLLDDVEYDLERAAVVVRIVSGALWGKPPNVPGISTLRIYWKHVLSVLAQLANIFVESVNVSAQEPEQQHEHDIPYRVSKLSMTLTLEVIVALGRLMENEMVRGRSILAKDEWEEFISVLEAIVIPCLTLDEDTVASRYTPEEERALRKPQNLLSRIRSESEKVLLKVGEYLDKCCRFEVYQCHMIVYDDCRDALHLLLLRKAVPEMISGTSLAIKVLRSWATAGFSPDRRAIWIRVATDIVADSFAVYEDHSSSKYGGYVHSPRVRLEAIGLLSSDEAYANLGKGGQDNDPVFLGPPLRASRFFPDEHHDLIRSAILPCLSLVFNAALSDNNSGHVLRHGSHNSDATLVAVNEDLRALLAQSAHEDPQHAEGRFKLRKYSIDLVGRLFCTATEYRPVFIGLLKEAGKMKPHPQTPEEIADKGKEKNEGEEKLSVFETNRSLLSLEAIGQLGSCLCAPFFSIASAHENLPALIEALCSILQHSCIHRQSDKHLSPLGKQQEYSFRLLSFAALLPLARLRRSFEGGLLLVEREEAMPHFPDGIVLLFSERQYDFVDDEGPFVAPFARLDTSHRSRDSVSTLVSLTPIVQVLVEVLQNPHADSPRLGGEAIAGGRGNDLENRFRASCFDALLSYNLSGLTFPSLGLFRSLLSFQSSDGIYGFTENFTRLRAALAAFQGVIQDSISSDKISEMVEQRQGEIHSLVEQLLKLCNSNFPEEVISGCKLLIGLFPSITACRPAEHHQLFLPLYQQILSTLMRGARDSLNDARDENSPEAHFRRKKQQRTRLDRGAPLLLLLYETSLYYLELFHRLESSEARALLRLCYDVTSCSHTSRACRTLAVRCAVAVLDRQDETDIEGLMDEYSRNHEDDLSTCGLSVGSQLLVVPETDIILSALARKSMNLSHDFGQGATDEHFALATEFDNIKLFDRTKESAAAWLCGDHLLTCKVGGAKSRNTGWVEIIIRGATFRKRELVRLSSAVSVDNPEIPSSLWGTPNRKVKGSDSKFSLEAPVFLGDETAMKNALDVLRRCELLLGPEIRSTPTTVPEQDLILDSKSRYSSSQADLFSVSSSQYPASEDSLRSTPTLTTQTETFDPDVPAQIDVSDPSSVRSWLLEVLGNPLQVEDVTKRLSEIGFQTILDSCTTKSSINKVDLHPVVRLQVDEKATRAVNLLDRTVALDTHKIALLYAAPLDPRTKDEEDEVDYLLKVKAASPSFFKFTEGLGGLVLTRHLKYFSAGFDTSGSNTDGEYALVWIENKDSDSIGSTVLTVFHGVPYMPLNVNNRKRHVGNDSVHVVFCEPASFLHEQLWAGGMDEEMENILISGEFGFVTIFVIPVSKVSCRVKVQLRPGLPESTRLQLHYLPGEDIMATNEAPAFVRRLANLADIACSAVMHEKLGPPTSWEIRLRQLRLMRRHEM